MNTFRPGVALFIVNDKYEVLLMQRKTENFDDGKWCLPGGGLERGEKPVDAFIRETVEETGIDLSDYRDEIYKIDFDTCYYPEHDSYHLTVYGLYMVRDNSVLDTLYNAEPDKCYQYKWIALDDLLKMPVEEIAFFDLFGVTENLVDFFCNEYFVDTEDDDDDDDDDEEESSKCIHCGCYAGTCDHKCDCEFDIRQSEFYCDCLCDILDNPNCRCGCHQQSEDENLEDEDVQDGSKTLIINVYEPSTINITW